MPKPKSPRRPSRSHSSSSDSRWQRWRWRLLQAALIGLAVLIAWMFYLNAVVRERFEGQRFTIPARVYSEAQELYAGAPLSVDQAQALLEQLGYRASDRINQPGRFQRSGQTLHVHTRGFNFWDEVEPSRILTLDFSGHSLQSVTDVSNDPILLARLDPLFIGQVYPGNREDRLLMPLQVMPPTLVAGLIVVEDRHFFEHHGVSITGIARALWANITSGSIEQGGSTLTQQLVKNLYLSSEQTLWRKGNEALMALLMEWHYDKATILEAYLNEVYVGQQGQRSVNGFGLGAQFFFGTPLPALDLHQQALLVGMIKGPSYYNPRRNPERALERRNLVLRLWYENGIIEDLDYQQAIRQPLDISTAPGQASYPAFMDLVRRQLAEGYRKEDLLAEGLTVFTTLNPLAQLGLEHAVERRLPEVEASAGPGDELETAALVTRPSTGDVLAMLGGRRPEVAGFNRALDARRSIGSLMKPAVYLAALEQGYTLATPISDAEVTVSGADGKLWQPRNYDKESHGNPLLIDALANSYNQATARLGMEVGLANVFDVIDRLGIDETPPPVPAVMLGAHGLSPFQVAQYFQTISGNGFYTPLNAIRAVVHPQQGVLQRFDLSVEQRFDPEQVFLLQDALHQVTLTGTARSLQWRLPQDWWLAGKTGTTDDNRDAWFAGYSGDRQAVVWVGRDNNAPMALTGSSGALPIWAELMRELEPIQERRGQPVRVDYLPVNDSGAVVPQRCDGARLLPFVVGTEPDNQRRCNADGPASDATDQNVEKPSIWERLFN
ncbi:penicillin-binding protein 1B [Saccharospirillum mangrovi]|uniref:penicillin-binding protein 1B n=1 Tax=Saccharospirillum mangrovi TaxID=2161747 RepID=UPI000D369AE7|nr:penicillin-binding protein 1B [Saccharospirillum mangrovi]